MAAWTCRRCDQSGEAPEGSRVHFHRCTPPPGPRRRLTLDELFPDERDLFDDRAELFRRLIEDVGP